MAKIWGIAPWQGRSLVEDKTVMDQYNADEAASSKEYKNTEEALGPPSIGPISLDPTDYIGPGFLTKAAATLKGALSGGAVMVGAMGSKPFLAKNPIFKDTLIKNKKGELVEVYRGLSSRNNVRSHNQGIWFGDTQTANLYARGEEAQIQPAYLLITKPTDDLLKWNESVLAKDGKYDGYVSTWGVDQKVWAVADPKQIKSSITGD